MIQQNWSSGVKIMEGATFHELEQRINRMFLQGSQPQLEIVSCQLFQSREGQVVAVVTYNEFMATNAGSWTRRSIEGY